MSRRGWTAEISPEVEMDYVNRCGEVVLVFKDIETENRKLPTPEELFEAARLWFATDGIEGTIRV